MTVRIKRLLAIAFACDITRVGSVQFTGSVGYTVFNMLGLDRGHHDLTHDAAENEAVDQATIFTIGQFAVLLQALRDMPEGDGNVLDNSAIIFMTEAGHGLQLNDGVTDNATHSVEEMVQLVAGRAGGLEPGKHIDTGGAHPAQNLISCMQAVGYDGDTLGEVSGRIDALFEA